MTSKSHAGIVYITKLIKLSQQTPIGTSYQAVIQDYDPNLPLDPNEIQYKLNTIINQINISIQT